MTKPGTGYPARELPFFSKLSLPLAVRRLEAMGYSVYADEIPIPPPTPQAPRTRALAQRPVAAPRPAGQ